MGLGNTHILTQAHTRSASSRGYSEIFDREHAELLTNQTTGMTSGLSRFPEIAVSQASTHLGQRHGSAA